MGDENSRRPRNLQGLLRFAMEATKCEDAPDREHNIETMDPERRQFLENALRALTLDVVEQLQNAVGVIASESTTEENKVAAMNTILNYIDDIDTAIDFCKIGGIFMIIPCLGSPYIEIRNKSALLVAELAQNNPYCQKLLLEADILPKLMDLLSENETVIDGLRAVSCLVRNYEPCLKAFTEIGGLECLIGCLQQPQNEKLTTRAAFLLSSLCIDFPHIKDELIKLKIIETIIPLIQPQPEYNICLETLLAALCSLIECKTAIERCRTEDLHLMKTLDDILKLAGEKPECTETVQFSQNLLSNIFYCKPDTEITDR